jgi:A/G-specific adenine glycosylase
VLSAARSGVRLGSEVGPPAGRIGKEEAAYFRRRLRAWFRNNARRFTWRETANPYHILLAEVLLQKTDAPKVVLVYLRMVKDFPTPKCLAAARVERLSRLLAPLGLDYRADRLRRIGMALTSDHGGTVPASENALMSLPGIGRYIARAVCAQAFRQRKAVLDTNVVRVLGRFFGITSRRPRARDDPEMWAVAQSLLPRRASDAASWNWALLDFAALVCGHRHPACSICPVRHRCLSQAAAS